MLVKQWKLRGAVALQNRRLAGMVAEAGQSTVPSRSKVQPMVTMLRLPRSVRVSHSMYTAIAVHGGLARLESLSITELAGIRMPGIASMLSCTTHFSKSGLPRVSPGHCLVTKSAVSRVHPSLSFAPFAVARTRAGKCAISACTITVEVNWERRQLPAL